MPQELRNRNGSTVIPGAYSRPPDILQDVTAIASSGIVTLVGEADAGPGYLDEADLSQNFFDPTQFPLIRAKYRSGRLVDAAFGACAPSQDAKLPGAPAAIYIVKTNQSDKASATLTKIGGGTYHYLADQSYGDFGNLISYDITEAQAEVIPTTGPFTLLIPNNTTNTSFRVNGGAEVAYNPTAATLPPDIVTAIDALSGVTATGGADRVLLAVAGTLAVAAVGNVVTITRSVNWENNPEVGDSLYIPSGSAIQGATNANRGSYVVTAFTDTTITATKLLDASGLAGANTAPEAVLATAIAATTDLNAFEPVTISLEAGDPIDGIGKALEWNELTTATGRLTDLAYQLNTTKVTFISKTATPAEMVSAAEYQVQLADARQLDNISELSEDIGGDIAITIGYTGTTATATITATHLTTSVTGGSGANLNLAFSTFKTISDLVAYVNTRPGYTATLNAPEYGPKAPQTYQAGIEGYLDKVSAKGICTTFGNEPGRFKVDARLFFEAVQETTLVQLGTTDPSVDPQPAAPTGNVPADAGLPDVQDGYLAGGAKNGTTAAEMSAAIDAVGNLTTNFGVLLIAQDATADIADGETESSSTYELEAAIIKARLQAKTLSAQFARKPRQWFAGISGSYVSVQKPMAVRQSTEGRLALTFEHIRALSPDGTIKTYQPWYAAVLAAGMQAGAFSRGIVHREPTQNGVFHAYGDFDPGSSAQNSDALRSGLLPLARGIVFSGTPGAVGRWGWVSDQTAYIRDTNFYYNSIQAIYVADLLRMLVAVGVENAIIGESSADVDAVMVKAVTESYLRQAVELGLLARDDEAPKGWVNVIVKQTGPTYAISVVKCKLATLIYFVDLQFSVSAISRSA